MKVRTDCLPWPLSSKLVAIIEQELSALTTATGGVLSFRDPKYSAETGGFHPVEVAVAHDGSIQYVTDFAYYGSPSYCELGKEIDFDFSLGLFQHLGREFPIQAGRELFQLWESNFVTCYGMGVYSVSAEPFLEEYMAPEEIVTTLCGKLPDPGEVVYVVTMRDLLAAIVRRLQENSLQLTAEDLLLARDEVQAVFGHYLDEHELFDLALDQWEIVRHL